MFTGLSRFFKYLTQRTCPIKVQKYKVNSLIIIIFFCFALHSQLDRVKQRSLTSPERSRSSTSHQFTSASFILLLILSHHILPSTLISMTIHCIISFHITFSKHLSIFSLVIYINFFLCINYKFYHLYSFPHIINIVYTKHIIYNILNSPIIPNIILTMFY